MLIMKAAKTSHNLSCVPRNLGVINDCYKLGKTCQGKTVHLPSKNVLSDNSNSESRLKNSKNLTMSSYKCYVNLHSILDQPKIFTCTKCLKYDYEDYFKGSIKTELLPVKTKRKLLGRKQHLECKLCHKLYSSKLYFKYHACTGVKFDNHDFKQECNLSKAETGVRSVQKPKKREKSDSKINLKPHIFSKNQSDVKLKANSEFKNTKAMPYACEKCSKTFMARWVLENHQRSHEKGFYLCTKCGEEFEWEKTLKRHIALHGKAQNGKKKG